MKKAVKIKKKKKMSTSARERKKMQIETKPKPDLKQRVDEVPPEPKRKVIAMRADAHTVVYIPARLSAKTRQQRFEQFCIKHRLGNYKDYQLKEQPL
jgi:hypothetical protein